MRYRGHTHVPMDNPKHISTPEKNMLFAYFYNFLTDEQTTKTSQKREIDRNNEISRKPKKNDLHQRGPPSIFFCFGKFLFTEKKVGRKKKS